MYRYLNIIGIIDQQDLDKDLDIIKYMCIANLPIKQYSTMEQVFAISLVFVILLLIKGIQYMKTKVISKTFFIVEISLRFDDRKQHFQAQTVTYFIIPIFIDCKNKVKYFWAINGVLLVANKVYIKISVLVMQLLFLTTCVLFKRCIGFQMIYNYILCCVCYCCLFVFFIFGHGVVSLFSIYEFDYPLGIFRPSFTVFSSVKYAV